MKNTRYAQQIGLQIGRTGSKVPINPARKNIRGYRESKNFVSNSAPHRLLHNPGPIRIAFQIELGISGFDHSKNDGFVKIT